MVDTASRYDALPTESPMGAPPSTGPGCEGRRPSGGSIRLPVPGASR
jgi:hypothetical protein